MINKIPIPESETDRIKALERYQVLDTEAEEGFDRITRLAAAYFQVPIALVSLVDETRQWFKSRHGLTVSETPREIAFCAHAICSDQTMVIPDALQDTRFASSALVVEDPNIRFYAGAPLQTRDGNNLGTLCVIDTVPRTFSAEQTQVLEDLSGLVIDQLELRLANLRVEQDLKRSTRNIELLRDNQARLNAIFNSTLDGILILDSNGRIESHNLAAELLFGYGSSELLGMHAKTLMPESFDAQAAQYFANYQEIGTEKVLLSSDQNLFGIKKSGARFPMELSISELRVNNDRNYTAVVRDMTEHKRSERALLTAIASAEKSYKSQLDLLSRISHELRTPLNAVLGFGDILQMDLEPTLTSTQKEHFEQILKGGKQLTAIIKQIMDYSQIESGKHHLAIESIQIAPLITDSWQQIQAIALRKSIKFRFEAQQFDWAYVNADLQSLQQVLAHLFSNAVKYNRQGGEIVVEITALTANKVRIVIADQGPGIAAEDRERIFDVFARSTMHEFSEEGVGIGLALSRAIMVSMHGDIGVDSNPGRGSRFYIDLPRTKNSKNAAPEAATTSSGKPVTGKPGSVEKKILYIEDEASNLKLVESLLAGRQDLRLISAMRGELGFALAIQHQPDLILLDVQLPDQDGYEVLKKLRANSRTANIPVIIVSADASADKVEKFTKAGVVDYVTKPFSVKPFLEMLDAVLD